MDNKASFINNLFSRIAGKYDLLNDIMTCSMHRLWKKKLVEEAAKGIKAKQYSKVLDLCTGTGDIAGLWLEDPRVNEVIAIDSCKPMLNEGLIKLRKSHPGSIDRLKMIEADATELKFPAEEFSAVTISFGLRNVKDPDACLKEVYRVLKPGGFFACLDLGHPSIPLINDIYKKYFLKIIPQLGSSIANDKDAYQYLIDSLETWPSQQNLTKALYNFGFTRAYYQDLMLGSIAIVVAEK